MVDIFLFSSGHDVIEEEKKRLYELKQRAAQEVKAQWDAQRGREINCKSFNSLESEESSIESSETPSEKETR